MSICKIFADNTSVFLKCTDRRNSENILNYESKCVSNWVHQWKQQFNPDPKKQLNEVTGQA